MPTLLDVERKAYEELEPGEELVWAGKPIPQKALGGSIRVALFGLLWTALSVIWMMEALPVLHPRSAGAPATGPEILFVLFGIPFMIIGIAFLSSPYWMYLAARGTIYAITNKRMLIIRDLRTRHIRSINPLSLVDVGMRERSDGSGDIIFNPAPAEGSSRPAPPWTFTGLTNVREVESAIRKTFPGIAA